MGMCDGLSVAPTSSLDNLVVVHHGVDCWWEPDLYGPVLVGGAEGGWAKKRREMFTHKISGAYVLFMTANPHRCHSIQTKTEEDRYDLGYI